MGCAPGASKPGQDVKLRLRAASPYFYVTHYGRQVPGTAYVDGARHYAQAASAMHQAQELSAGGIFSGNCVNSSKSAAYSIDLGFLLRLSPRHG